MRLDIEARLHKLAIVHPRLIVRVDKDGRRWNAHTLHHAVARRGRPAVTVPSAAATTSVTAASTVTTTGSSSSSLKQRERTETRGEGSKSREEVSQRDERCGRQLPMQ